MLPKLTQKDNFFVSDNSILWRYIYNKKCPLSYIEHGAASYRTGVIEKNWKYFLKAFLSLLRRVNLNLAPNKIYLSDNFQSNRFLSYENKKIGTRPISFNLRNSIHDIFEIFFQKYKEIHFDAYKELEHLIEEYRYKNIYIYLPTTIVPNSEYQQYLNSQMLSIKSKENVFLIKAHGNDSLRDYNIYFRRLKLDSFCFKEDLNNFIPAEILLFFFNNAKIFGSYSSSHLYSRWWLNKETIFAEDPKSSVHELLLKEYYATYDDMHKY
jgi:hypothetical protein